MKIYNIKFKYTYFFIILALFLISTILCIFLINSDSIDMTSENFSKILKECHDAPYTYEGKKVNMVGYVFRANDFKENQFVVARDMLINESESRIIGFLCEAENAQAFKDNEWVCASGTIHIGNYHGTMPIIKIKKLEPSTVPEQIWVYPPINLNFNKPDI